MDLRDNGSVWDTHHGAVGWGDRFAARPSTNTMVISGVLDQRNEKRSVIQETLPSQK